MKPFIHVNAKTVDEAILKLSEYSESKVIAGGTDCLSVLKSRVLPTYPEVLVNLKTIPGLDAIAEDDEGLKIGALAKLADIAASPLVMANYAILAEAAKSVATPQIRDMATLGGNLCQDVRCWYYRHPHQIAGRIVCLRKGGTICNALAGDNRYHSIFGGAPVAVSSCSANCPAETAIASCLSKVRNGEFSEAARMLMDANPMPAITGRVCPTFCEPACHRNDFDEPVAIRSIERSLGDYILERTADFFRPPERESGKSIAIVGSGPAGLVAAYFLRTSGHQVTVFEKQKEAGGMLLYSIPPYRLPKDVVRRQIQALEGMGIMFEVGVNVGKDVTVASLMGRFDAVFLAGGAWEERPLGIKGEEIALSGLEFLNKVNSGARDLPGRRVAVIGGGNVAIDVARTLRRLHAEPVVIYRRSEEEMPAIRDEVEKAQEEGIAIEFLTVPTEISEAAGRITLTCLRIELGPPDASGRPQPIPIPGSDFTATFDAVVKAIGEEPDASLLPARLRQKIKKAESSTYQLGKNLFSGGDFITGSSTVVQAIASGREAAILIEQTLSGDKQPAAEASGTELGFRPPSFRAVPRVQIPELSAGERVKGIEGEDIHGLPLSDSGIEADRCFNCGCLAVSPSDMGVVLLALDATIVTTKRTLAAKSFFAARGAAATVLDPDELVTEIQVPKLPAGAKQTFRKFRMRKAIDFAIVSVASVIAMEDGICTDARIALGAVAPTPIRATKAEAMIKGKAINAAMAEEAAKAAVSDAVPLAMNAYKVEIAKVLVKRAILT